MHWKYSCDDETIIEQEADGFMLTCVKFDFDFISLKFSLEMTNKKTNSNQYLDAYFVISVVLISRLEQSIFQKFQCIFGINTLKAGWFLDEDLNSDFWDYN